MSILSKKPTKQQKDIMNLSKPQTAVNFMIDSDLHKKFKMRTTLEGVTMTTKIVELIRSYSNGE